IHALISLAVNPNGTLQKKANMGDLPDQVISELWYMSANPDPAASNDSMAPTSSPAANTLTFRRPPESAVIDCAARSAADCRPGKVFGPVVTILSSRAPWAMAGFGKVEARAATPTVAAAMNCRRFMVLSLRWQSCLCTSEIGRKKIET